MIKANPARAPRHGGQHHEDRVGRPTLAVVAIRTEGAMAVGGVETLHLIIGND
jgi:hypothetical protein